MQKRINKKQAIRDYLAKHPNAGASAISRALSQAGVTVSAGYVSSTLSADRRSGDRKRGPSRPADLDLNKLVEASQFANRVGGVRKAKQLVAVVGRLTRRSRS